ncbi:MAG: TetR/AcrR family transcriptional regulator [Caldimonas sp.]
MAKTLSPASSRKDADARTRIVDAAERAFAEHGYHAVSLRTVMTLAQVNVAAAHYYFGSRENLLQAVLERRAQQINAARKERLLRCIDRNGESASVEKILEAYIGPALEICSDPKGWLFVRVSALASVDPSSEVQDIMQSTYDETAGLFVDALKRACPKLKTAGLYWRLQCVYGAMLYLRANNGRVARILNRETGPLDARAVREALRHIVPFLAAGFGDYTRKR